MNPGGFRKVRNQIQVGPDRTMNTSPALRFARTLDRMFPNWCHFAIVNWRGRRVIPVVNTVDGDRKMSPAIVPAPLLDHPGVRGQRWIVFKNVNHRPRLIPGRTRIEWSEPWQVSLVVGCDVTTVTIETIVDEWDAIDVLPEDREVVREVLPVEELLRKIGSESVVSVSYRPFHGD